MRIVIIGGGQVGSSLSRALSSDHEVVVVDHDPAVADVFHAMDVQFLLGSGTSADVLQQADIARADFFVAATALDEVNIVACALANRLGHPKTICLVSRAEFLEGGGLSAFGITRLVWPEAQLAADIEQIVTSPGAIDAEVFAGGVVRLLEYRLGGRVAAGRRFARRAAPAARVAGRGRQTGRPDVRAARRHHPPGR